MKTVWVERRAGAICSVNAGLQPGQAEEELPEDHPDVVSFLTIANGAGRESVEDKIRRIAQEILAADKAAP